MSGQVTGIPGKPSRPIATSILATSINITWSAPDYVGDGITGYNVRWEDDGASKTSQKVIVANKSRVAILSNISPYTSYTIEVQAFNGKGGSPWSFPLTVQSSESAPSSDPVIKKGRDGTKAEDAHTIRVVWEEIPQKDQNGIIIGYSVFYNEKGQSEIFSKNATASQTSASIGGLRPFTIYCIKIAGYTKVGRSPLRDPCHEVKTLQKEHKRTSAEKTDADDTVGIIAAILGALLLIAIVIIGILLSKRNNRERNPNLDVESLKMKQRRNFEFKRLRVVVVLVIANTTYPKLAYMLISDRKKIVLAGTGEMINHPDHPPIPVAQFGQHVAKLHESDDRGYKSEHEKLENIEEYEATTALLPGNKSKNRYANIIAYDHSRVALTAIDGVVDSDYVNASLIDGYNKPNAYIATQGPVTRTFHDFWRMVWEKQSSTIVMLTNLRERNKLKCDKYWPDEAQDYGDISVMLVKSEHYSDYIIRTFNVKRESENVEREVKQFHFTSWPGHGVPEYPTGLLAFRRRVRAYHSADAGPMIVHCSAGVGRTGTFMAIDSTLDRIKVEKTIDIFNYVSYLRTRRAEMVQTEGQYAFCHDAVLEAVQCGNTQIYAHSLRVTLDRMDVVSQENKVSRFETEFKTLNKVSPVLKKECYLVASYPENKEKNRSPDILAPDFSRVVLTAIDDNEPTSYINAVNIPGYKQQHAFIVTHYPLTPTVTDFWRMLCEQECSCVVLFDCSEEDGDFPLFWPENESTYDDMITVHRLSASSSGVDNLKANYDQAQIAEKMFRATDLRADPSSQFLFNGVTLERYVMVAILYAVQHSCLFEVFREVSFLPAYSHQLLAIAGELHHAVRDGLGRSGTFCALYSALERLKIEQVVDVFQTIEAMRISRPGLVRTATAQQPADFDAKLKNEYPKLELAGGYVLMCGKNTTRKLFAISPPYTVRKLKELTGQGKIFVRPLQRDLDVTPDVHEEDEQLDDVIEMCYACKKMFYLAELSDHLKQCNSGEKTIHSPSVSMSSSSSSSSQSEVTSVLSASPSQQDSQHADETPCSQQDPLAQNITFISELNSQPEDKEPNIQADFPARSDPQANSTASIPQNQCPPENTASSEQSQQHFTPPSPEVLVPDNDEDLLVSPFEPTTVSASPISSIVKEGTLYCKSKGLDNNPVEVLRYFQSKIVEGRALEIVDPASSSEGETNLIYWTEMTFYCLEWMKLRSFKITD
ncbi:receptor-type tyrosine-protein phosphatase alpha-like [Montipora capricornis]|uniref:receptor-type tyrosine-protein phosphatase alpha-like n=1 Tax=Montipora capricornis TaxID=246305 RepID=UPI0035F1926F